MESTPRATAQQTAEGSVHAGVVPVVAFFRQEAQLDRLGRFGVAASGRSHSVILFSRRPIRQLDGAAIAVTQETTTSVCLLRLILEQRYRLAPASYSRTRSEDADALLLIGDEALAFARTNKTYPFEIDLAFEWWLWQHLPFVFAVWAVRKEVVTDDRKRIESAVARALGANSGPGLDRLAQELDGTCGMPAEAIQQYLSQLTFRLGNQEEEGILRFRQLLEENGLIAWDPA